MMRRKTTDCRIADIQVLKSTKSCKKPWKRLGWELKTEAIRVLHEQVVHSWRKGGVCSRLLGFRE